MEVMIKLNNLLLFYGLDIPIPKLQVNIHQPTILEISYIGEEEMFNGIKYLTLNQESLLEKDETCLSSLQSNSISNYQLMNLLLEQKKEDKNLLSNILFLFFPECTDVIFTLDSINLLKDNGELFLSIDDTSYEILSDIIRNIMCLKKRNKEDIEYKAANAQAQAIIDKIMKGRKKVAEVKEKNENESKNIIERYSSILCVMMHKIPKEIGQLTLYQFYDLLERNHLKDNSNIDLSIRLAGGEVKQETENWEKAIH